MVLYGGSSVPFLLNTGPSWLKETTGNAGGRIIFAFIRPSGSHALAAPAKQSKAAVKEPKDLETGDIGEEDGSRRYLGCGVLLYRRRMNGQRN